MATLALPLSDTDILAKVTRARDRALALYPWFGALAMGLRIKQDTRIPTMATDGTSLFFNPMGCAALSEPNLMFIWAHEVMHCGLLHMYRKPSYLDWHEWNVCTDLAINGELIRLAVGDAPASILRDARYDGLSAEQIAHARRKARQQAQQAQADRDAAQAQADAADDDTGEDDTQDDAGDDSDSEQDGDQGQDAPNAASNANEQAGDGASEAADQDAPDADGTDTEASGDDSEDADGQPGAGAGDAGESEQDAGTDAADDGTAGNGTGQASAGAAPVDAFDPDGSWQPGDDCLPPSAGQSGDQDADGQGQRQAPAYEPRTEADWQLAVDQTTAAMRKAGEMPGSLVTMVNATRRTRTDWREVTRAFIEQVSPSDYTWRRANRRFASQGLYLPGIDRANLPPMMVIVDSSGSCGQAELDVFASALTDILGECKPRAIYVVYCDTQVNGEMTTFTPEADTEVTLTAMGGGGTYFQPAFDWVSAALEDGTITDPPACILYLTDMYAADIDRLIEPDLPVLWAVVPGGSMAPPPFGELVEMEID